MGKWLLVVLVVAVMVSSGLAYGQAPDQPYPGDRAGVVVGPAPGGPAPEMAPPPIEASPQPAYPTYQPQSGPQEVRIGGDLNVRLIQAEPKVVYRDRWRTRTVPKTVPTPASTTPVIVNIVPPAASPAPAATPPPSGGPTSTPAPAPAEGGQPMGIGWMIVVSLAIAAGAAIVIMATVLSNGRQVTRQAQAAQLAGALANQAPYVPSPGREVEMNVSIFPDGGGVVRARSNERAAAPQVQALPPATPAVVVTAPNAVTVVPLAGTDQPPVAQPGQLVAPPAPPAPQPPAPPAPPAPNNGGGGQFDASAAAAAGANA